MGYGMSISISIWDVDINMEYGIRDMGYGIWDIDMVILDIDKGHLFTLPGR
jgi:hypothetical protein